MTQDSQNGSKVQFVNVAKAFSIILVVYYHACVWLPQAGEGWTISPVASYINSVAYDFRMPVFFVASGLFAAKRLDLRWGEFFTRKLSTLVWVFLLWQVVILGYKVAADLWIDGRDGSLVRQLGMTALTILRPNGESWFLWALVVYLVAAKLLRRVSTWLVVGIPAIISAIWSSFVIPNLSDSMISIMGPGIVNVLQYFVFFIAASRFSGTIISKFLRMRIRVCIALVALWVGYGLIEFTFFEPTLLGQILAIAAGLALARLLDHSRVLQSIGTKTLPVYMVHTVVIVVAVIMLSKVSVPLVPEVAVWAPFILTLLALGAGLLVERIAGDTWLFTPPTWFRKGTIGRVDQV